jgi:hypothetical protein
MFGVSPPFHLVISFQANSGDMDSLDNGTLSTVCLGERGI